MTEMADFKNNLIERYVFQHVSADTPDMEKVLNLPETIRKNHTSRIKDLLQQIIQQA